METIRQLATATTRLALVHGTVAAEGATGLMVQTRLPGVRNCSTLAANREQTTGQGVDMSAQKPRTCPMMGASAAAATGVAAASEVTDTTTVRPMSDLDGPVGWPVIGNFLSYLKKENRGKMHEVQARHHRTYGKIFREKWGPSWQCHVSDPNLIEEVYRQEGRYPNRPSLQPWLLYRLLTGRPAGLTSAQGHEWQKYRSEFSKRMLSPKTSKSLVQPFNDVADSLVAKLRHVRDTEGELALTKAMSNELYKWSFEASGTFLFETRMGCLDLTIPARTQEFIDAAQEMLASSLYLIVGEKLHHKLNTKYWRRHKKAWDKLFEIATTLVDERFQALKASGQTEVDSESDRTASGNGVYLTYLLSNKNITLDEIISNVTEILLAGTDTSANSFSFIAYLLASHPEVQEKLYDEVTRVMQDRHDITSVDLEDFKYLKCVLKETMRLYPVVTMNCRILQEDIVLGGYLIPKQTLFVLNHYATGRDEDAFQNADKFIPERWFREGAEASRHHPFGCLPFGFGNRSCVGQRIAKMEMALALVKVLRSFKLEMYPGLEIDPMLRTLLCPGTHVPVRLVDRV